MPWRLTSLRNLSTTFLPSGFPTLHKFAAFLGSPVAHAEFWKVRSCTELRLGSKKASSCCPSSCARARWHLLHESLPEKQLPACLAFPLKIAWFFQPFLICCGLEFPQHPGCSPPGWSAPSCSLVPDTQPNATCGFHQLSQVGHLPAHGSLVIAD